uniref:Putative RNA-directed DNA polymerase from transposon X-element n=1 Tax=Schistocephalus solidus TaxID=70667 RepID=A0A0X3PQL9_SCHSO
MKTNRKPGPQLMIDDAGQVITDDNQIANLFNKYFSANYSVEEEPIPHPTEMTTFTFNEICFSEETVKKAIRQLSNSTSYGTDKIPPCILKHMIYAPILLSSLFSLLQTNSMYPEIWKYSSITPIFKNGNRSDTQSYRGVHRTAVIAKILEKIISKQMLNYLTNANLIPSSQHAFLPKKSCQSCHLTFLEFVSSNRDDGNTVATIYFDLKKAFDKVPHQRLLVKLKSHGIGSPLLDFLKSYLQNRYQVVQIRNVVSEPSHISSGVLQGTILGPLLFLIYIHDLSSISTSAKTFLYADDLKLAYAYNQHTVASMHRTIENDLKKLSEWSTLWQMPFSPSKCHLLIFGSQKLPPIFFNNQEITETTSIKDLGLSYTNTLDLSPHVKQISPKATRLCGFICKNFSSPALKTRLYKMYVLPLLDYCSIFFGIMPSDGRKKLEAIQRCFTRSLSKCDASQGSYMELYDRYGLQPVWIRRLKNGLTFLFKITHDQDILRMNLLTNQNGPRDTRNSENIIKIPKFKKAQRSNFYSIRYATIWNALPNSIRNSRTIREFKIKIKQYMLNNSTHLFLNKIGHFSTQFFNIEFGPKGL